MNINDRIEDLEREIKKTKEIIEKNNEEIASIENKLEEIEPKEKPLTTFQGFLLLFGIIIFISGFGFIECKHDFIACVAFISSTVLICKLLSPLFEDDAVVKGMELAKDAYVSNINLLKSGIEGEKAHLYVLESELQRYMKIIENN